MNCKTLLFSVLAFGIAVSCSTLTRGDESPRLRRWAIIASGEVQQAGLSDLVFAQLAGDRRFELVEREQLAAIGREAEFARSLGAADAAARLRVAALTKSDALLLLSLRRYEQATALQVVICDAKSGARLYDDFIPYDSAQLEGLAKLCAEKSRQTAEQFSAGVKSLVAVPPFISRDLSHRHDAWQVAFPQRLEQSLRQIPGTAAIEIDEARAIAAELAGKDVAERVLPLFVEGEFATTPAQRDQPLQVHLRLRVRDSPNVLREKTYKQLTLAKALDVLSDEAPRFIAQASDRATPLSAAQQISALTERADRFASVGSWRQAIALREAALLVDLVQPEQHRKLVKELLLLNNSRPGMQERVADIEKFTDEVMALWRPLLEHLEYLVRNRHLRGTEAANLFRNIDWATQINMWYRIENAHVRWPQALIESKDDFFWRVYPLIAEPNAAFVSNGLMLILESRKSHTITVLNMREDAFDERDTFAQVEKFLHETCPPALLTEDALEPFFCGQLPSTVYRHRFKAEQVDAFLKRMVESKHSRVSYLARVARLRLKIHHTNPEESADTLRAELELLMKDGLHNTRASLSVSRGELDRRAAKGSDGLLAKLEPPKYDSPEFTLNRPKIDLEVDAADRPAKSKLTLKPVPELTPEWIWLQQCRPELDLMWNFHTVWRMQQPGKAEKIFQVEDAHGVINTAAWDGRHLWVATTDQGVLILSTAGKILQTIGVDEGLPEYFSSKMISTFGSTPQGVMLHAIEPGKCLAVGRIGEHQRVWYATLSWNDAKRDAPPIVKVFHTCDKVVKDEPSAGDELERTHVPCWISDTTLDGDRRILIGGHRAPHGLPPYTYRPLVVNPETLAVSRFAGALPEGAGLFPPMTLVGSASGFLTATNTHVEYWHPTGGESDAWKRDLLIKTPVKFTAGRLNSRPLLAYGNHLYWPHLVWYRIDPKSQKFERLTQDPPPPTQRCNRFGISAHYGLVAWRDNFVEQDIGIPATGNPQFFQMLVEN